MTLRDSLHVALANLRANKVRSFFSMLGIVIGTCSVIVVVSMVNGTRVATLNQFRAGKENMLILRPTFSEKTMTFGKINMEDVDRLKRLPTVLTAYPDVMTNFDVRGTVNRAKAMLVGVDSHYVELYQPQIVSGRFFDESETNGRTPLCLVSDQLAQKIFGFTYPVGQRVRVENRALEVVGVFKTEERLKRMDQTADILVPYNTLIAMMKFYQIPSVQIRAMPDKIDETKKAIQELIKNNPRQENLLDLSDMRDYEKEQEKWGRALLMQVALIAGISLIVGGVGLMNVMLTTVVERTHEIGLRKALGANSKMILTQFLVESSTLSGIGGLLGVSLGVFVSYSLNVLSDGKVMIDILPSSVIVSFLFSLGTGVIFGLFPASKAAHLSPVEALRYE